MAELFGADSGSTKCHIPGHAQTVWQDPETGFIRRSLTPATGSYRGSMIEGILPTGATISYAVPPIPNLEHHLVLLEGALSFTLGPDVYELLPGDALRFRLNAPNSYHSAGDQPARYFLTVITS
jgi:quercetin dioxygenase-like cupin family protein